MDHLPRGRAGLNYAHGSSISGEDRQYSHLCDDIPRQGLGPLQGLHACGRGHGISHSPCVPGQALYEAIPEMDALPQDPVLSMFSDGPGDRGLGSATKTMAEHGVAGGESLLQGHHHRRHEPL